jgi:hypothetical protein
MSSFYFWNFVGSVGFWVGLGFFGLFFGFLGQVDFGSCAVSVNRRVLNGLGIGPGEFFVWTWLLSDWSLNVGRLLKVKA